MNQVINGVRLIAAQGDLTRQDVDAVVNAANEYLQHGGGVAAAIVRSGGHEIQQESDEWVREHGPVTPGSAAVTSAGAMPARWVIHVVGPRFDPAQDNAGLLNQAVVAALDAAAGVGAQSVALPAISAGIFGYPPEEAALVIVAAATGWVHTHGRGITEIRFVAFDDAMAARFEDALT
ncbi:MAG: macro domain-containing protein [Acidimicrobiia bacterium]|nr:macro domain-containing protein [Acidimicrobiia bacterium]